MARIIRIAAFAGIVGLLAGCSTQPQQVTVVGPDLKPALVAQQDQKASSTIVNWSAHDPDATF
ncbi:MAG: hypothetical protein ACREQN_06630 [Candidatus Binataceae bacterium]